MRLCLYCGRWFKNKQAVKAHLQFCPEYEGEGSSINFSPPKSDEESGSEEKNELRKEVEELNKKVQTIEENLGNIASKVEKEAGAASAGEKSESRGGEKSTEGDKEGELEKILGELLKKEEAPSSQEGSGSNDGDMVDVFGKVLKGEEVKEKEKQVLPIFLRQIAGEVSNLRERTEELEVGQADMRNRLDTYEYRGREREGPDFPLDPADVLQEEEIRRLREGIKDMEEKLEAQEINRIFTLEMLEEKIQKLETRKDAAFTRGVVGGIMKVLREKEVLTQEGMNEILSWGILARRLQRNKNSEAEE
ncbi:hypothetical protein AKJ45_00250 [candidate division MSBL1 archaeon SCGC-AAA261F19]|uniref:Uncharacterized protein n=1 Tax=candidate division MSBL1 archaeon SCGC-AAA261F19 TaxID=1698275 RepID=A0A133VBP4_9EURY|nr:hypothetical protein AKJ45_00250 [candidate division MSBL1 archaeon SCGC-AAA261F19]